MKPRITAAIDNSSRVTLAGSRPPRALADNDIGAVPGSTKIEGITLTFSLTAAQQTALDALIAAQQNPASPQYHQWLTPEQYAAQFGMASSDIAAVESWLEQQGFTVDGVSRSRTRITFSGTAAQVESAFGAPLHYFRSSQAGAQTHFAPAADLAIPAALSSSVLSIRNLSNFRPHPQFTPAHQQVRPNLTSYETGNYYLDAKDLQTMYHVTAAYNAGYTGTGESIAVVGQSAIIATDVTSYQTALGYPAKAPTVVLVPNSGASTINPFGAGDEAESDLDLEYASTMAPGATVTFYYTGAGTNADVFNALSYAIDQDTAPIISISYGDCEAGIGEENYLSINANLAQAATQGQAVVAASGDYGSTDCANVTGSGITTATQQGLAVDFPASSQYVIGMGGTEIPSADLSSSYFASTSGSGDVVSSLLTYPTEQVWNDDSSEYGISSGGGGASAYTSRPSWQTGVPGIPAGTSRLVPDISLDASNSHAPLAYCTSDTSGWSSGQESSCTEGLRDEYSQSFTIAGGTSFATPTFAGMLAVIYQGKGVTAANTIARGGVDAILYSLAANSGTYATAFHDITTGGNECIAGAAYCSSTSGAETDYLATTGYDEASGLGSVDLYNLLTAWPGTATASSNSFTVTAAATTVTPGTNGTSAITVTPANGYTGTVNFTVSAVPSLTYACYLLPSATVTGTTAVTSTLTIVTSASSCASGASPLVKAATSTVAIQRPNAPNPKSPKAPMGVVAAGVLVAAFSLRRRTRRSLRGLVRAGLMLALVTALGLGMSGLSGCSSGASGVSTTGTGTGAGTGTSTASTTPAGTYTITVTGVSATNSALVSTTTFTLTVS